MDWEMYDLDGEEVVIRPLSRIASRRRPPAMERRSTKPMPRSAGSVNLPGRCEYVMELIRFCHDYDAVLQCSNPPLRKHHQHQQHTSPPSDTHSRQLRPQSSGSSLRHKTPNRSTKRRPKQRKSKERLLPTISTKKLAHNSTKVKAETTQCKDGSSSTTPVCGSQGLHRLPLSTDPNSTETDGDDGKDVDCECHYPGVSVLPGERGSDAEVEKDQTEQADEILEANENIPETTSQSTETLHFTHVGNGEETHREDSVSSVGSGKSANVSTSSQQAIHTSHLSPASPSVSSELESPSTVATSPLYEILAPFSEASDEKNSKSKHIDSRFLPRRGSSKKANKNVPSGSTSPSCQLGEDANQVPSTSTSKERAVASVRANNGRDGGPERPRLATASSVRTGRLNDAVTGDGSGGRGDRYLDEARVLAARSKSFDTLPSAATYSKSGMLPGTAASDPDLPDSWLPTASSERPGVPGTQQQKSSRSARIFAQRMRDNKQLTRNISYPLLRGQTLDETQIHASSPGSATPTQEEFLRKTRSHLPQSPRRAQCPSSPPDVPLPADPPVPPSRHSSRNQILGSITRGTVYPSQVSSDSLATQRSPSRRPSLVNVEGGGNDLNRHDSQKHQQRPSPPAVSSSGVLTAQNAEPTGGSGSSETPDSGVLSNNKDDHAVNPNTVLRRRGHQDIKPISPTAQSPQTSGSRCPSSYYYYDTNAQQPSLCIPTSPEPQTPDDLEFRVAFLEQQNKMLHDALVAALDSKSSAQDGTETSPRADGSFECSASPARLCTSPVNSGE